jgi:hypothetical protein
MVAISSIFFRVQGTSNSEKIVAIVNEGKILKFILEGIFIA